LSDRAARNALLRVFCRTLLAEEMHFQRSFVGFGGSGGVAGGVVQGVGGGGANGGVLGVKPLEESRNIYLKKVEVEVEAEAEAGLG